MKRFSILGCPIDSFSRKEVERYLTTVLRGNTFSHVATVNPEFLVEANKNHLFFSLLRKKTDVNLCDGVGISLFSKILYRKNINRISGVETAEILIKICEQEQKKVSLIGGFGVVNKCKQVLQKKFPNIIFSYCEDGNPDQISELLIASEPDAILVAFGAPKQEFWIQNFASKTTAKVAIGVGGTFDFWAGKSKRAPKVLQRMGLEWLWRLITEPKRIKRIMRAVFVFPLLAIKEKLFRLKS